MHRSLIALAAAGALALVPATAGAATGGTATLDKPFKWSGGPGQGLFLPLLLDQAPAGPGADAVACTDVSECDDTLVKVEAADAGNDFTVNLAGDAGDTPDTPLEGADLDLFVYKSDASGAQGDEVGNSTSETANESVVLGGVEAGYYLVRVHYYEAVNATYDATATLSVPVPPDPEEEEE